MNGVEEAKEEGEVDGTTTQSTKVHVRGVDRLNTFDIRQWAEEHYSSDLFKKVQWIDDTSANLIYDTEIAAAEALSALSAEGVADPLQLRQAKSLSTYPEAPIQVRQAIVADAKAPGAKDRSAFYLFNKEWDPDNPDNIRSSNRKRRWGDGDDRDRKYRRRDYGDNKHLRRGSRDTGSFHEDMYDDAPKAATSERRNSSPSGNQNMGRRGEPGKDLFAGRESGRLRNRSASPGREGDGRYGFEDEQPRRPTARPRSRTPPGIRGGRDNHGVRDQLRKELFPDRKGSTVLTNGHSHTASRESFSTRPSSFNSARELFPDKLSGKAHRRQEAKELHPDEIADAIGKYNIDGANEYRTYSRSGRRPEQRPERKEKGGGKDLFSRINGGPQVESTYGRLQDRPPIERGDAGFAIKGAGRANEDAGFSILGASRENAQNPLVKELFPVKAGGSRDLFDGRIKGRGAQRRRAEDLF